MMRPLAPVHVYAVSLLVVVIVGGQAGSRSSQTVVVACSKDGIDGCFVLGSFARSSALFGESGIACVMVPRSVQSHFAAFQWVMGAFGSSSISTGCCLYVVGTFFFVVVFHPRTGAGVGSILKHRNGSIGFCREKVSAREVKVAALSE
jgi:hypothetical protein